MGQTRQGCSLNHDPVHPETLQCDLIWEGRDNNISSDISGTDPGGNSTLWGNSDQWLWSPNHPKRGPQSLFHKQISNGFLPWAQNALIKNKLFKRKLSLLHQTHGKSPFLNHNSAMFIVVKRHSEKLLSAYIQFLSCNLLFTDLFLFFNTVVVIVVVFRSEGRGEVEGEKESQAGPTPSIEDRAGLYLRTPEEIKSPMMLHWLSHPGGPIPDQCTLTENWWQKQLRHYGFLMIKQKWGMPKIHVMNGPLQNVFW